MDPLDRNEILAILSGMGVELPPATKLPTDALDKRLKQAINSAQSLSSLIPNPPLDPAALPVWSLVKDGKENLTHDAIMRGNLSEATATFAAKLQGKDNLVELFTNAAMDLRQTLMALANAWDLGCTWCIIQDPDSAKYGITVRILGVYELDERTPVIVLLYQSITSANPGPAVEWVQAQMAKDEKKNANIKASELELKLILKLLAMNAKHLPSTFNPKKERTEQGFNASFFLPVGPLSYEDMGKLNNDPGCVLCGKKTTSRCSQCQSVSYCGTECQRADWSSHKSACRSLKGGTWRTLSFTKVAPGMEGPYDTYINRYHSEAELIKTLSTKNPNDSSVPPNVHGSRVFLIKLQVGLEPVASRIMIYDRQRTFGQVFLIRANDPQLFKDMMSEMNGPRGGYRGVKMYRFAKRLSDWELSICLDKEPQTEVKW